MLNALILVNEFAVLLYRFAVLNQCFAMGIKCLGQDSDPQDSDPIFNMKVTGKGHKNAAVGIQSHESYPLPNTVSLLLLMYCKTFISVLPFTS